MARKDPRVDDYIAKTQPFARPILKELRRRVHAGCPECEETLKWGRPAFMYKGILCGMSAFKEHATFGFWDQMFAESSRANEAAGQFGRLTSVDDLPSEKKFASLMKDAVARRDAGVKPKRDKTTPKAPLETPAYFTAALKKNKKAFAAFQAFSPSHRREYVEWITEAKQEATRERRIATALEWLAEGKSRNWKYERP